MAIIDFVNFNGERLDLQDSALTAYVRDMSPVATVGSADMVSVDDAAPLTAEGLVVNVEPVQAGSGNPSPTNVRPISGWDGVTVTATGKNLLNLAGTDASNGFVSGKYLNANGEETTPQNLAWCILEYARVKPSTAYVLSDVYNSGAATFYTCEYDKHKNFVKAIQQKTANIAFTTTADTHYVRVSHLRADTNAPMLEEGSIPTAYEPYKSRTASVDFGQTVYGGTVDLATGECVVDRAMVDLGTLTWNYISGDHSLFSAPFTLIKKTSTSGDVAANAKCSIYPVVPSNSIYNHVQDMSIAYHWGIEALWVYDSRYTDAASFKAAMSGVQLVYELANPIPLTLDPAQLELFKGTNNISADAGQVTVTYRQDVYTTLLKKINNLRDYTDNIADFVDYAIEIAGPRQ